MSIIAISLEEPDKGVRNLYSVARPEKKVPDTFTKR
jgi:hypothetical protein